MFHAIDCKLFLYADDSCLMYQHRYVKVTEQNLNKDLLNVCDTKFGVHLGQDKTKAILFEIKRKVNKDSNLNISYGTIHVRQYYTVTYLVACYTKKYRAGDQKN